MILVTGATGTVGSHLVGDLCRRGVPVRALVRSPERADTLRGYDCEVAIGDYTDAASLDAALADVSGVFLVSPYGDKQVAQEGAVVSAVGRAGATPHVVKLAALGVDSGLGGSLTRNHQVILAMLAEAGLPHTVLAPNIFMQSLLWVAAAVQEQGVLPLPYGDGAVSLVDAADVAAVAAHVLAGDHGAHAGATYDITGPRATTGDELAAAVAKVAEREVRYVAVPEQDMRLRLETRGLGDAVEGLIDMHDAVRAGDFAVVTDEVQKATGRPARSVEEFLADHASAFAPAR